MLLRFIGFLLIGRVLVFVGQKFPVQEYFTGKSGKFLADLTDCDMCFGTWIYGFLSIITGMNLVDEMFGRKSGLLGNFITGAVSSFTAHIFRIGWQTKFSIIAVLPQSEE